MDKLRVGIIGGGAISKNHINGYRKAGAEVVVVCDINEKALAALQTELNIPNVVTDADKVYADDSLDAVSVCTPNSLHHPMTVAALNSGKHVLVEKPMAMNPTLCQEMVDVAKANGKILMCGHNQRFTPEAQRVNEMRDKGMFGDLYHVKCGWIRRRGIPGLGGWFTTRELSGGGPLIDIGIHLIDRTWYMMGKPKPVAVSGITYSKFGNPIEDYVYAGMWAGPPKPNGTMDVEDFASAMIRFDNGATMAAEVSWAVNRPDESPYSILMGDKCGARIDGNGVTLYGESDGMIATTSTQFNKDGFPDRHQHFVDCITKGIECTCPGEDGLTMQKILYGIQKSSEEGAEVRI